jgi:hypothetical protein
LSHGPYLVGIVTKGDIEKGKTALDMVDVGSIKSKTLIWTKYNTTQTKVAETMEFENIKRLPIFGNLPSGPIMLGMQLHEKAAEPRELEPGQD